MPASCNPVSHRSRKPCPYGPAGSNPAAGVKNHKLFKTLLYELFMADEVKKSEIDWTKVKFFQKRGGRVGISVPMLMPALEEILANNVDLTGVDTVFMSPTQKTKESWKTHSYCPEYELEFKRGEEVAHKQIVYEWIKYSGRDELPDSYHCKPQG